MPSPVSLSPLPTDHRSDLPPMDSDTGTPSPSPAPAQQKKTTPLSGREDCWSAAATDTLIEAWGERFLDLNRGSLRQKHWQEVAAAVNSEHAGQPVRTDVQCKNRIDTLKKKYKIEKARAPAASPWPFFSRLDALLGPSPAGGSRRIPSWSLSSPVPVGRRSSAQKRAAAGRSLSAFAAAVAAMEEAEEEEAGAGRVGELAAAIERLGETYERVERAKQRQMMELERQRMQFAKDLECQRMQLFMDTQLHLQRIKRAKPSPPAPATATTAAPDNYA